MVFSFGQEQNERIEVDVVRYERSAYDNLDDANWLDVQIRVRAGGFAGNISAAFVANELTAFLMQLRRLLRDLAGGAAFSTLEEQMQLRLSGDKKGHIDLVGEVADQPGSGNRLRFHLSIDQSQLASSIRELEAVVAAFPERVA